jgi:hypothetical protein
MGGGGMIAGGGGGRRVVQAPAAASAAQSSREARGRWLRILFPVLRWMRCGVHGPAGRLVPPGAGSEFLAGRAGGGSASARTILRRGLGQRKRAVHGADRVVSQSEEK